MFKGCHFPSEVILETIRYYLAYKLSYREIEEIQLERGVIVDHATINRWVKQKTRQALGWKSVEGARASLHGREMWTMLKRDQIDVTGETACESFYVLAE